MSTCRCGRETESGHPCHAGGYTCPNQGSIRFYDARPISLAGMQPKVGAAQTWACDGCWNAWKLAAYAGDVGRSEEVVAFGIPLKQMQLIAPTEAQKEQRCDE